MTRPFESELPTTCTWFMVPTEADVVGLLRRAAGDLARLERISTHSGTGGHLAAAAHAVHRALVELEPLG